MKREDINIRDPFILPYEGKYYLYGSRGSEVWEDNATGLDVYVSDDLENWSEPKEIFTRTADFWADRHYWAPEVYAYNGAFYMFASFKSADRCRGTMVLKADKPDGKFTVHSEGCLLYTSFAIDKVSFVSGAVNIAWLAQSYFFDLRATIVCTACHSYGISQCLKIGKIIFKL